MAAKFGEEWGFPRSGDARQQVEAAPSGGHCGERSPGLRGAGPADPSSPRPPGRLVGTNTSCSGPEPRSWPGGGGGALPKRPQGRSSGFPQAHTRGRPGAALGPLPAAVSSEGPVCVPRGGVSGVCEWRRARRAAGEGGRLRACGIVRRRAPARRCAWGAGARCGGGGVRVPAWETLRLCVCGSA